MKKKIVAVLLVMCLCFSLTASFACAATKAESAATTQKSTTSSSSYIASILRALLGDAADNLTNNQLLSIAQKVLGDFDISSLFGSSGSDAIKEILEYIASLETTTDTQSVTKPSTTEESGTAAQSTTEAPATTPSTTAQAQSSYIYVYVDNATTTGVVQNFETVTGEDTTEEATTSPYAYYTYAPGTEVVEELSGSDGMVSTDDESQPFQFTVKTIIGVIVLLAAGVAVVILCIRKKASY